MFLLFFLVYICHIWPSSQNLLIFSLINLPEELQTQVFEYAYDNPTKFIKRVSCINKEFNEKVARSILQVLKFKSNVIGNILLNADQSIQFKCHLFDCHVNGFFEQQYYKCPFTIYSLKKVIPIAETHSKGKMLAIIKTIRFIANKNQIPVNEVAKELSCNQYIRYHNEFVFRSIFPMNRFALKFGAQHFIRETFQDIMFDLLFEVDLRFVNNEVWLDKKIRFYKKNNKQVRKLIVTNERFQESHGSYFSLKYVKKSRVNLLKAIAFLWKNDITIDIEKFLLEETENVFTYSPFSIEQQETLQKTFIYLPPKEEYFSLEQNLSIEAKNLSQSNDDTNNSEVIVPPIEKKSEVKKSFSLKCFLVKINLSVKNALLNCLHFIKIFVNTIKTFLQRNKP